MATPSAVRDSQSVGVGQGRVGQDDRTGIVVGGGGHERFEAQARGLFGSNRFVNCQASVHGSAGEAVCDSECERRNRALPAASLNNLNSLPGSRKAAFVDSLKPPACRNCSKARS